MQELTKGNSVKLIETKKQRTCNLFEKCCKNYDLLFTVHGLFFFLIY